MTNVGIKFPAVTKKEGNEFLIYSMKLLLYLHDLSHFVRKYLYKITKVRLSTKH